jgi:hypothetical protein
LAVEKREDKSLLVDLLRQWSLKHKLGGDPYLNSIIKTVENDLPLHVWTELEAEEHLPRPKSEVGTPYIKASRYLAIVRNVLVFVPVAITWKAVSEATQAFARFVASQNMAPVNFLEFWQNGYGELSNFWKIGNVAEIDFYLIIMIIATTLLSTILLNYGRERDEKVQRIFDQEREVVIFEIKSFLHAPAMTSVTAIDKSLRDALRNLNAAANSIATAASKLEKSLIKQERTLAENQSMYKEVKGFQGKILKAIKKLPS